MKNGTLIKWWKAEDLIKEELRQAVKTKAKLNKQIQKLQGQLYETRRVTSIYKGVALMEFDCRVHGVGEDYPRGGYVYKRVDTGWFGVVSWEDSFGCQESKTEFVPGWKTHSAAVTALKEWIIGGPRPKCLNSVHWV